MGTNSGALPPTPGCRDPRDEESGEVVLEAKKLDIRDARDIAIPVCHGIVEIGLVGDVYVGSSSLSDGFYWGVVVLCQALPFREGLGYQTSGMFAATDLFFSALQLSTRRGAKALIN